MLAQLKNRFDLLYVKTHVHVHMCHLGSPGHEKSSVVARNPASADDFASTKGYAENRRSESDAEPDGSFRTHIDRATLRWHFPDVHIESVAFTHY